MNTAIFSPSGGNVGIGFAIPSNLAKPVIDSLMKSGKVARGWLGVRIQSVTDEIAESLGLPRDGGRAGRQRDRRAARPPTPQIQAGDVILEFDGKTIDQMRSLPRLVAETAIGKDASVKLWRKGQEMNLTVVLGELPEDEQRGRARPAAGSAVSDRRRQGRAAGHHHRQPRGRSSARSSACPRTPRAW